MTLLAVALACLLGSAGAVLAQPDDKNAGATDQGVAPMTRWVFCTGSSDSEVLISDVFKARATAHAEDVSEAWSRYLHERYQASGSCSISAMSKAATYSARDSAVAEQQARSHVYHLRWTGWSQ